MSEHATTGASAEGSAASPAAAEAEAGSIGSFLARQRELRGISLEEFAEFTRIPIRSLKRLESGRFDQVSDGFARGFVRTVAEALGLDVEDALARMQREVRVSDDPHGKHQALVRRAALVAGAVVFVAAFVGIVRAVSEAEAPSRGAEEVVRVYRRDPVRSLAEAQLEPGDRGSRSPSLRPR